MFVSMCFLGNTLSSFEEEGSTFKLQRSLWSGCEQPLLADSTANACSFEPLEHLPAFCPVYTGDIKRIAHARAATDCSLFSICFIAMCVTEYRAAAGCRQFSGKVITGLAVLHW